MKLLLLVVAAFVFAEARRSPYHHRSRLPEGDAVLSKFQVDSLVKVVNNTELQAKNRKNFNHHLVSLRAGDGGGSGFDTTYLTIKGVQLWLQDTFLGIYSSFNKPNESAYEQALPTYNNFKYVGFDQTGKSGVISALPNDQLRSIVDIWVGQKLVSDADAREMKIIIARGSTNQKFMKHSTYERSDGSTIFGVIGYISLKTNIGKDDPDNELGTLVYALGKFKYTLPVIITKSTTNDCILWGLICHENVEINTEHHQMSGTETDNLMTVMKYQTLKDFELDNGKFIDYLRNEKVRYERFLPSDFTKDHKEIDKTLKEQPEKRPDTEVTKDPFDPSTYGL